MFFLFDFYETRNLWSRDVSGERKSRSHRTPRATSHPRRWCFHRLNMHKNLPSKAEKKWNKKEDRRLKQTDALILASNVSKTENVTRICSGATAVEKWLVLADLIDAVVNIASVSRTFSLHQRYGNIRTTLKVKALSINYNFSLEGKVSVTTASSEWLKNHFFDVMKTIFEALIKMIKSWCSILVRNASLHRVTN